MKIRIAKFYQAISLHNGVTWRNAITHLDTNKDPGLKMTIEPGIGLRIEGPADTVLVTFNNIASMHPERPAAKEAAAEVVKEHAPTLKKLSK